jgi:recombination protein RecT
MSTTALTKTPVIQLVRESTAEFAKRLPPTVDAGRWVMQLATALQKNPDLSECDPRSLLLAAYEAAELGISLSPSLQLGFLIPYKGRVQFQISWRGLVQKAYESGCLKAFYAEIVYKNDKFERQYAPKRNLFHAPADGDRGEAVGAYSLVEFSNGSIDWEFCSKELIERHRKHSKQPDSLMWREFWEEAWKKTVIRLLAKRLPLSNPGMETLAEVIERDAQGDLDAPPAGKLELESDSVLLQAKQKQALTENSQTSAASGPTPSDKPSQIAPLAQPDANMKVLFEVGEQFTIVSGHTIHLREELPKIGGRWDGKARVWTLPAARTDELVALCQEKQIPAEEVGTDKPKETGMETLWPGGEK